MNKTPASWPLGVSALICACAAGSERAATPGVTPQLASSTTATVGTNRPEPAPAPRTHFPGDSISTPRGSDGGQVLALDHYLYWLGGTTGWPDSRVRRFDTRTKTWAGMPPMRDGRMHFGATSLGSRLLVVGGMESDYRDSAEWYDIAHGLWTRAARLPEPLGGPAVAAVGESIYVFGGSRRVSPLVTESVQTAYLLRGSEFTRLPDLPNARSGSAPVVVGDKIYLLGGRVFRRDVDNPTGAAARDVTVFDTRLGKWSEAPRMLDGGQGCAVSSQGKLVFFEEHMERSPNVYDLARKGWIRGAKRDRDRFGDTVEGCAVIDKQIYVISDRVPAYGPKLPLVLTYDPKHDAWEVVYEATKRGDRDRLPEPTPEAPPPPAASKQEARCGAAFDHMQRVSQQELEALPLDQRPSASALANMKKSDAERRRKFIERCEQGSIDVACILKSNDTVAYIKCLAPKR
ncbi:MAG: hypothetical protein H6718_01345 [Polyangiaceae bacterium]|nr:hypothetical protein [Polyangiaceae bacterium]